MSAILADAFAARRQMREDFELYRHALFTRAHDELRGELLNARGRAERIDPYSLFMGPAVRAECYASEELRRWWERNDRPTVAQFEAAWWAGHAPVAGAGSTVALASVA